jgi:hypothetical protein
MTVQCCVCEKVRIEDQWLHTDVDHPATVSHTYCPVCLEKSLAAMRVELAKRRTAQLATA